MANTRNWPHQLAWVSLKSHAASHNTCKWEQMWVFYSSFQLWPSAVRPGVEGGSPLVWMTLYPPLETVRLQTYAWDGHLSNFMPWTAWEPDLATRPQLISHAIWNFEKKSKSSLSPNSTKISEDGLQHLSQYPVSHPQQSALASQSHGLTKLKGPNLVVHKLNPISLAPMTSPKRIISMRPSLTRTVILIYLLYIQQSNTRPSEKFITSLVNQNQSHPQSPNHIVKSWKSCFHWMMEIIKWLWDTAWDLITYWNVESGIVGFGLPTIMWKATLSASLIKTLLFVNGFCPHCLLTVIPAKESYMLPK